MTPEQKLYEQAMNNPQELALLGLQRIKDHQPGDPDLNYHLLLLADYLQQSRSWVVGTLSRLGEETPEADDWSNKSLLAYLETKSHKLVE